jgi:hypothetical protein
MWAAASDKGMISLHVSGGKPHYHVCLLMLMVGGVV